MATKSEIERLSVVETKVDALKEGQERLERKIDNFIKASDAKYSPKYVEKAFWIVFGGVAAYVLNNLLELI